MMSTSSWTKCEWICCVGAGITAGITATSLCAAPGAKFWQAETFLGLDFNKYLLSF